MIRRPVASGQFYSKSSTELRRDISKLVEGGVRTRKALGVVMPHAGYVYSGSVAGATISSIKLPKRFIILGPNHTGYGKTFSVMSEGVWTMPFGEAAIDSELAGKILDISDLAEEDPRAHTYEHSIEVEIPFLQYFSTDFKFVPIVISDTDIDSLKQFGLQLAEAIGKPHDDTLVIASSDFTHYEPHSIAVEKDKIAINAILDLDINGLAKSVKAHDITMCGLAPICAMLSCVKKMGAAHANLVKYQTSGESGGDLSSVVGYAGIVISRD